MVLKNAKIVIDGMSGNPGCTVFDERDDMLDFFTVPKSWWENWPTDAAFMRYARRMSPVLHGARNVKVECPF